MDVPRQSSADQIDTKTYMGDAGVTVSHRSVAQLAGRIGFRGTRARRARRHAGDDGVSNRARCQSRERRRAREADPLRMFLSTTKPSMGLAAAPMVRGAGDQVTEEWEIKSYRSADLSGHIQK